MMDTAEQSQTLAQIPANRGLVEELYAHQEITREAREHALNMLHPRDQWGPWISRLLLAIGAALILSGIIYFFAFNWNKITPLMKLSSIQFGIIGCLIGAWFYSLQRRNGQASLLSASVLVGVFMAVFGQIYQTGADAYQLFMTWSLLILGWTLISKFAAQWLLWLTVTNIALVLWWAQAALPTKEMAYLIFIYMTALNGSALALREYLSLQKEHEWLEARWTRSVLISVTLLVMLIPIAAWITGPTTAPISIVLGGVIGIIGNGAAYFLYRYKFKDISALAATALSYCIIVETAGFKILNEIFQYDNEIFQHDAESFRFLLMGLMTLGAFTCAIIALRKIAPEMEAEHVIKI